jgi:hypothetical protein
VVQLLALIPQTACVLHYLFNSTFEVCHVYNMCKVFNSCGASMTQNTISKTHTQPWWNHHQPLKRSKTPGRYGCRWLHAWRRTKEMSENLAVWCGRALGTSSLNQKFNGQRWSGNIFAGIYVWIEADMWSTIHRYDYIVMLVSCVDLHVPAKKIPVVPHKAVAEVSKIGNL